MWIFRSNSSSSSPSSRKKDESSVQDVVQQEKVNELVRLWKEFAISKTTIARARFREIFDGASKRDVSTMLNTLEKDRDMLVDLLLDVVESQEKVSNVFLALSNVSKSDSSLWNEKRLSRLLKLLRDCKTLERKQDVLSLLCTLSSDEIIKTKMAKLEEIRYIADILVDVKDESLRSNSLKSLRKLLKFHDLNEDERVKKEEECENGRFRGFAPWLGKWLNARTTVPTTQKVEDIRTNKKRPFPPPREVLDAYQKRLKEEEDTTITDEAVKNQTLSAMIAMLTHGTKKDFLGALRAVRIV